MSAPAIAPECPTLSPYASAEFNARFWQELKYLGDDAAMVLGPGLIAVVLGGGFGRCEGCIAWVDGNETPYNDVDLFLITKSASIKNPRKLQRLAERYEHRLGIAVDFSRPQTPAMVARWEPLLMWQELAKGHIVLYGPKDILTGNVHPSVLEELPLIEASRLLLNRGAGLLSAARVDRGLEPAPDASFVVRNYFKCAQALADAVLIGFGMYASDPPTKKARIEQLAAAESIVRDLGIGHMLQSALAFRRAPHADYAVETEQLRTMAQRWCHLFLWLENKRLGSSLPSMLEYVAWKGSREPHRRSRIWMMAVNARRKRIGWHHPREQVYRTMAASLQQLADSDPRFDDSSPLAMQMWRQAQ